MKIENKIHIVSICGQDKLYALGSDGTTYMFNRSAFLEDGKWEISGLCASDFRFWIPLPEIKK